MFIISNAKLVKGGSTPTLLKGFVAVANLHGGR